MKYDIKQAPFGILLCQLEQGESMKCQQGGMAWMTRGIEMATKAGGLGKMFKKAITKESIFFNTYTACMAGEIAFSMSFPGQLMAVDVSNQAIVAQKGSFMACEESVEMDIFFRKNARPSEYPLGPSLARARHIADLKGYVSNIPIGVMGPTR